MSSVNRGSKEFYNIVESFEKSIKALPIYVSSDLSKVARVELNNTPKHYFYNNGEINNLFLVYMSGYVLGKSEYMN